MFSPAVPGLCLMGLTGKRKGQQGRVKKFLLEIYLVKVIKRVTLVCEVFGYQILKGKGFVYLIMQNS